MSEEKKAKREGGMKKISLFLCFIFIVFFPSAALSGGMWSLNCTMELDRLHETHNGINNIISRLDKIDHEYSVSSAFLNGCLVRDYGNFCTSLYDKHLELTSEYIDLQHKLSFELDYLRERVAHIANECGDKSKNRAEEMKAWFQRRSDALNSGKVDIK